MDVGVSNMRNEALAFSLLDLASAYRMVRPVMILTSRIVGAGVEPPQMNLSGSRFYEEKAGG